MEQASWRRAFLGRDAELALFERALAEATDGAPSVLLVSGDAGMGETTLVQEAADRAGVPLLLGRCMHVGGHGLPLAPLLDLVRRGRRAAPDAGGLDTLTSLLTGGDGARPAAVFEAALDLVVSLGRDGVVMVGFEDLHWADALTWDLVDFLVRNVVEERVVLIGTYRHHDMGDAGVRVRLAELGRLPNVRRLHLDGLAEADVVRHVAAVAGDAISPDLISDVIGRGQGNPLFTEELGAARAAGEQVPSLLADLFAAELDQGVRRRQPSGRPPAGRARRRDGARRCAPAGLDRGGRKPQQDPRRRVPPASDRRRSDGGARVDLAGGRGPVVGRRRAHERQIGEALFVSEKTASVHVSNILRKLGVTSRVEAAAVAQRVGMS